MPDHVMACAEWQEDLAAWIVAQIPPDREARLDAHLATCTACRAEADSLLAMSALLLSGGPDPERAGAGGSGPPPDLGHRIRTRVARERRSRRVLAAGLVALAGAAAGVVLVVVQRDDGPPPVPGEEVAFSVVPDGARVEAVIAEDDGGSVVQLTASGLDPDTTYALWLSPPGGGWEDRVPAGTFRPDGEGAVDARFPCALPVEDYGRAWATTPEGEIALDTR